MQRLGYYLCDYLLSSTLSQSLPSSPGSVSPSPGLSLFLVGDVGSGKTTFSRGFIRRFVGDPSFPRQPAHGGEGQSTSRGVVSPLACGRRPRPSPRPITSPTYLIDNVYDYDEFTDELADELSDESPPSSSSLPPPAASSLSLSSSLSSPHPRWRTLHHLDLYRLRGSSRRDGSRPPSSSDNIPSGCVSHLLSLVPMSGVFERDLSLVEWPDRLLDDSSTGAALSSSSSSALSSSSSSSSSSCRVTWSPSSDSGPLVRGLLVPSLLRSNVSPSSSSSSSAAAASAPTTTWCAKKGGGGSSGAGAGAGGLRLDVHFREVVRQQQQSVPRRQHEERGGGGGGEGKDDDDDDDDDDDEEGGGWRSDREVTLVDGGGDEVGGEEAGKQIDLKEVLRRARGVGRY